VTDCDLFTGLSDRVRVAAEESICAEAGAAVPAATFDAALVLAARALDRGWMEGFAASAEYCKLLDELKARASDQRGAGGGSGSRKSSRMDRTGT